MNESSNVTPISKPALAVTKKEQEALSLLSLDQLATRYHHVSTASKLELGFIILAARVQANAEYKIQGFDNPDKCFGNWVSLIMSDTPRNTITRLRHLAEFFTDRPMESLSITVGYMLSRPKYKAIAPGIYDEIIKYDHKVSVEEIRNLLGATPMKAKLKPKLKVVPVKPVVEKKVEPVKPVVEKPVVIRELPFQEFIDLLPPDVAEQAVVKEGKMITPRYAGLKQVHAKLNASVAKLTKKESNAFKKVVAEFLTFHGDLYDCVASARKTAANIKLEKKLKSELDKAEKAKADYIAGNFVSPLFKFHKNEIKLIRSCLHPDRVPSEEIKKKAFVVFQRMFN